MTASYQHLALADVKPGMILSDQLLDRQGQVLLAQGTVLSAAMLALLPGHGIDTLTIARPAHSAAEETRLHAHGAARLARLFRHAGDDDASAILRRYITSYRLDGEIAP